MRTDEITSSEEYRIRAIPKFANFRCEILVFQIEKNSKNFPNFRILKMIRFRLSTNS